MTLLLAREFQQLENIMEKTADRIYAESGLSMMDDAFSDPQVVFVTAEFVFFKISFGVSVQWQRDAQTALYVFDRKHLTSTPVCGQVPTAMEASNA